MNIKLLEAFLAVIDYKTMSAAAEKLFTTQPNISLMIKDLEGYYSTQLFNRISKKLYLTPEGEQLEIYARILLADFKKMNQAMLTQHKTIRIGSSVTVGQYLLNGYVEILKSNTKNINFEITINNTEEIEKLLLSNKIDVAFVEGKINSKNIVQVEVAKDELIAVISHDYPLDITVEHLADLASLPWISRENGSHHRNQFESDMNEQKIYPQVVFSATNLETIIQAVKHHYGFAIISKIAAKKSIHQQSLKKFHFSDYSCPRSIRFIYNKSQDNDPLIGQILDCINYHL
ncbi:MAG TPA: LysR family transcriptional regulator [Epulopiscium sp.]|nr:LysR family transcriptional regulator [Candidatus Epulonipiscium sp.]